MDLWMIIPNTKWRTNTQTLPKKLKKQEHFQPHFMRLARQGPCKKKKLQANFPDEYRGKNPQENTSKLSLTVH